MKKLLTILFLLANCTVINENFYNSSSKYPFSASQLNDDCSKLTNVTEIKNKDLEKSGITLFRDEQPFNYHTISFNNNFYSCYGGVIYKIVSAVEKQDRNNIENQIVRLYGSPSGSKDDNFYWIRGKNILAIQPAAIKDKLVVMYFILATQNEIWLKNNVKSTRPV